MKLILFFSLLVIVRSSFAVEIASCYNPSGKAYYPELGLLTKERAGWSNDKISGGIFKLKKIGSEEYDVIYVDATKKITSSKEDGGKVLMLSHGENVVTFLVAYPGQTTEIYTFLKTSSGKYEYIRMTNLFGDSVLIAKASIMRGDCDRINFSAL